MWSSQSPARTRSLSSGSTWNGSRTMPTPSTAAACRRGQAAAITLTRGFARQCTVWIPICRTCLRSSGRTVQGCLTQTTKSRVPSPTLRRISMSIADCPWRTASGSFVGFSGIVCNLTCHKRQTPTDSRRANVNIDLSSCTAFLFLTGCSPAEPAMLRNARQKY